MRRSKRGPPLAKQILHLGFPTQGALPRAAGARFSMAGKEALSCLLAPTCNPHLQGKCPLCASHTAHCVAASVQVGAALHTPC